MTAPSRQYFGTDGVRGRVGGPFINQDFAWRLGAAAGKFTRDHGSPRGAIVLIGRDTRASGLLLERAVAGGLTAAGLEPVSLGVLPTPAVSLGVQQQSAALGVVVTASHNPATDNGIKFFGPRGYKLTDEQELQIEQLLPAEAGAPVADLRRSDGISNYLQLAKGLVPKPLDGWRVVVDASHGATTATSPRALRDLGAEIVTVGTEPDGTNINAGVGSEHPETMRERVVGEGARLGVAHDGDGDRCILCDEKGGILDGDEILTILALHALRANRLPKRTLVITVQSNLGVDAAITAAGGRVCRTPVGDRYVIERMLQEGALLGGESSGHIISADVSRAGDGLVAALRVIAVMQEEGRPLSELRKALRKFPQLTAALAVREKPPLESLSRLPAEIRRLEAELGGQGRVLVRYSGTEPKLRLLVEGPTDEVARAGLAGLEAAARADLPVA